MRDRQGKFAETGTSVDREEEHLDRLVQFRITGQEFRMGDIMFSQHRQQFGWQTMSDMYRDFIRTGAKQIAGAIKKPTRDMITALEQTQETDKMRSEVTRHIQLEEIFTNMEESIVVLTRAGDLGAIRDMLGNFQDRTKRMTDWALKQRREMEFDRRWGRLWRELDRPVSLKPSDQEEEE